jgi:hypothetical protein
MPWVGITGGPIAAAAQVFAITHSFLYNIRVRLEIIGTCNPGRSTVDPHKDFTSIVWAITVNLPCGLSIISKRTDCIIIIYMACVSKVSYREVDECIMAVQIILTAHDTRC